MSLPGDSSSSGQRSAVDTTNTAVDPPPEGPGEPTEQTVDIGGRSARERREKAAERFPPGTAIGRYLVIAKLGAGGMGVVLKAYDPELDRRVAIKYVLHRGGNDGEHIRARLVREAHALAQLSHPNVVPVYDVGTHDGEVFLAMELVEGQTLKAWLREKPRTPAEIVPIFLEAGAGLAAAHRAALTHRDFKPDNVILGADGRVRVLDFGLAHPSSTSRITPSTPLIAESSTSPAVTPRDPWSRELTVAGAILGTPAYMSPEQFLGEEVDAFADQFSFSVCLYEALYGERPWRGKFAELRELVLAAKLPPAPAGKSVPSHLRKLLERGLARAPHERFASMDDLLAALRDDPRARLRRRITIASALVGASMVAFFTARTLSAPPDFHCDVASVRAPLIGVWDGSTRREIESAFTALGNGHPTATFQRLSGALDDYTRRWTQLRQQTCEATHVRHEQAPPQLALQNQCFNDRLVELATLSRVFKKPTRELVDQAVAAVAGLPPLEQCLDRRRLAGEDELPADPKARVALATAHRLTAEATALHLVRQHVDGLAAADRAVAAARIALDPRMLTKAIGARALHLNGLGKGAEARTAWRESMHEAARAGDDEHLATAWSDLIFVIGDRLGQPQEALAQREAAELAVLRAGGHAYAGLLSNLGSVEMTLGRLAQARELYERALAQSAIDRDPDELQRAAIETNLANCLDLLGKSDDARSHYLAGIDIYHRALGEEHPFVAIAAYNFGDFFLGRDELDEAERRIEMARRTWEKNYGRDYIHIASALVSLAEIKRRRGLYADARTDVLEALRIRELALPAQHIDGGRALKLLAELSIDLDDLAGARAYLDRADPIYKGALASDAAELGDINVTHGSLERALGHYDGAERAFSRGLAIYQKAYDPDHENITATELLLARVALERHAPQRGIPGAERAVTARLHQKASPSSIADAEWVLARLLWESGSDRTRAVALAASAGERLRAGEVDAAKAAEIETWLLDKSPRPAGSR